MTFTDLVEVEEFLRGGVEAYLGSLGFTESSVEFGLLDAVVEVGDDVGEARTGLGIEALAGAADAGVLVFAGGAVGAAALAEFEFAGLEVLLELSPFLLGWFAVLGLRGGRLVVCRGMSGGRVPVRRRRSPCMPG